MKQILIIDGYNFIYSTNKRHNHRMSSNEHASAREALIHDIAEFAAKSNEFKEIIIVFDGKEKDSVRMRGIKIIYSDSKKTADQLIEQLIASYENKKNITLISNDNVSVNIATGLGVKALSSRWLNLKIGEIDEKNKHKIIKKEKRRKRNPIASHIDKATLDKLNKLF